MVGFHLDVILSRKIRQTLLAAALSAGWLCGSLLSAAQPQWIWSPEHRPGATPQGAVCHFRKTFSVRNPEAARIAIAADDAFELFLNGRRVGTGESTRKLLEFDLTRSLNRGGNVIAVRAVNKSGKTAALVAELSIKEQGGQWKSLPSDKSWTTNSAPLPLWNTVVYAEIGWEPAREFGPLGSTAPWDVRQETAESPQPISQRFEAVDEFDVEQLLPGKDIGSLIAMAFNEFGHIVASREGDGLYLIYDSNGDKLPDSSRLYGDKVKNCQGILPLNGELFVTGDGPDGPGLYRQSDKDRDGVLESVRLIAKFPAEVAEHGAHGLTLGPDGLIYVLLGNHASCSIPYDPASPHRDYYEGDLIRPRYEDPGGHAVGVKAPGGVVIRTDAEGAGVQVVAGGLRNPYDLCFNRDGELFIHDADMESDDGASWYRPTRLCHLIPGAEYGWRSGWAKWPEYYPDSLPATLDTGRGSPSGIVCYDHFMYPQRYHGAIFSADWSQGRILVIRTQRVGASYTATSEVFVEGNPLNVTDLDVGPDGCLYFCTGGRGTSGALYRVKWLGEVPAEVSNIGTGLSAVIRQPQPQAPWARQGIASQKRQLGSAWDPNLLGVALAAANPPEYRTRALELMQLYGPEPEAELLIRLSRDTSELVRAKAAELMGLHPDEQCHSRLIELLDDTDRLVRRRACEALSRADQAPPADRLLKLLVSDDRFEVWAARRLLERMPEAEWRAAVLASTNHRLLAHGSLALLTAHPTRKNALDVLEALLKQMQGFVSDRDFVEMLRVCQVALLQGELKPEEAPGLRRQLAEEFPAGNSFMNRELARLLIYLQEHSLIPRYLAYLRSDAPDVDKLHVALHLRFLESGWTPAERMELFEYYELANRKKGGGSYARYIINAARDVAQQLGDEEVRLVLSKGEEMPNAALAALYRVPEKVDDSLRVIIEQLDSRLEGKTGDSEQRLKVGLIAVLSRSGDAESLAYLRKIWDRDPERRQAVSVGLAQHPDGENWAYLVRSLSVLEPAAAKEVMTKLTSIAQAPEEPEAYRQAILLAIKMKEKGSEPALELLEFWTGEELPGATTDAKITAWQAWFAKTYPDLPPADLPRLAATAKHTPEEILAYLDGENASEASAERGLAVFAKAQCAKCHRHGDHGQTVGPDLSTLANRFTRTEMLESILFPSQVISSQYQAKTILTTDGKTLSGLVVAGAGGEKMVITSTGERIELRETDIEEIKPSNVSSMPSGLLDTLTLEEIADLMALLKSSNRGNLAQQPGGATDR